MIKLKASLRKIIGRVDKVKLVRDLLLIVFLATYTYFSPLVSELSKVGNTEEFNQLVLNNPIIYYVLLIPVAILIGMLLFIHKIDSWEDKKAENRHKDLLKAIQDNPLNNSVQELINEIRQDRNERKNSKD